MANKKNESVINTVEEFREATLMAEVAISDKAVMASYDILKRVGRIEAMDFLSRVTDLAVAKTFTEIKNSKEYKNLPYIDKDGKSLHVTTMEEFCQVFLGKSYDRCYRLAQNLNLLGEELYEQAEQIGFTARDYQALKALPADEQAIVKQAIETEDKEHVIDLLQEMAVKHNAEKEKLTKQLADSNASLEASRTTAEKEAKRVIAANNELEKLKKHIKDMSPVDVGKHIRDEVTQYAVIVEQSIKSFRHALQELTEHGYKHGIDHTPFISGVIGQVSLTFNQVKLEFKIDDTVVDDNPIPKWQRPEALAEAEAAIAALPAIGEE